MKNILLTTISCILIIIEATSASEEYIVITDPSLTTPSEVLSTLLATNRLRRPGKLPKINKEVEIQDDDEDDNVVLDTSSQQKRRKKGKRFGLATDLTLEDLASLRTTPGVIDVVENIAIQNADVQMDTTQWNLDRVDQLYGRDGTYTESTYTGNDVDLYVIDTGVYGGHTCFGGRVLPGSNAVGDGTGANEDCGGHGTHVASTAAGTTYGIAYGATIIPVKVLSCAGQGTLFSMTTGVAWAVSNMKNERQGKKAVVNLSIQANGNSQIDDLIRQLHKAGAVVVVAAGNYNSDACGFSPAREPFAVTVGATSEDDSKLSVSNYGSCVDIYAPGDNIVGAAVSGPSENTKKRGTSMASPLVAGIAATLREKYPQMTNDQIISALLSLAKPLPKNIVDSDCAGTLLNVKFAQTLTAANRITGLTRPRFSASGNIVNNEFQYFPPDLTIITPPSSSGEVCFTFSAQVTKTYSLKDEYSFIDVSLATASLPISLSEFFRAPEYCKDLSTRYYSVLSGPVSAYVKDFQGNKFANYAFSKTPSGQLSKSENRKFYFVLKQTGQGMHVEFGKGDGSQSNRQAIVEGIDPNELGTVNRYKYISFSSYQNFDVTYSDIRSCGSSASTTSSPSLSSSTMTPTSVAPTASPTPKDDDNSDPGTGGGSGGSTLSPAPIPNSLSILSSNLGTFTVWPSSWSNSGNTCFQFRTDFSKSASTYMAISSESLINSGFGDFTKLTSGNVAFHIEISSKSITIIKNGELKDQTKPSKRLSKKNVLKVEYIKSSATLQISLYNKKKKSWLPVYSYLDVVNPITEGITTRYSLSSSIVQTLSNIATC